MKTYVVNLIPAVNIRLYFWGLALVTVAEDDPWVAWFRRFMFPSSRKEYWFLTRHLWRNWWWIGATARKRLWKERPREFKRFSGLSQIPTYQLKAIKLKAAENILNERELARACFDMMIGGLENIKDKPVNAAALQEHFKDWKEIFITDLLESKYKLGGAE